MRIESYSFFIPSVDINITLAYIFRKYKIKFLWSRHKVTCRSGGTAPLILNSNTRQQLSASRLGRFIPGKALPVLDGPQKPSGRCGLETILLPLQGIQQRSLRCPAGSLVTAPTELSRLPIPLSNLPCPRICSCRNPWNWPA